MVNDKQNSDNLTQELKPSCPFCGGELKAWFNGSSWCVSCSGNDIGGKIHPSNCPIDCRTTTEEKAIELCNTRHQPEQQEVVGHETVTSSELFQALGLSKSKADKQERELNSIMRRQKIKTDNTHATKPAISEEDATAALNAMDKDMSIANHIQTIRKALQAQIGK